MAARRGRDQAEWRATRDEPHPSRFVLLIATETCSVHWQPPLIAAISLYHNHLKILISITILNIYTYTVIVTWQPRWIYFQVEGTKDRNKINTNNGIVSSESRLHSQKIYCERFRRSILFYRITNIEEPNISIIIGLIKTWTCTKD